MKKNKQDHFYQKSKIEDRRLRSNIEELKFQTSIEKSKLKTNLDSTYDDPYGKRSELVDLKGGSDSYAPSYGVIGKASDSRVSKLLSNLKSKKDMVLLKEIIGPPKSLQ